MGIFPRMGQRTKVLLPVRSNLQEYNEIPELTTISSNTFIPSVQDGPTVAQRYRNLTINAGVTLTTQYRCCGLVLIVDGDLTVNGTISMTARGAHFQPNGGHRIKNELLPAKDVVYEIDIPATADEIAAFLLREKRRYHSLDELPAIVRPTLYCRGPHGNVYTPADMGVVPSIGGAGGAGVSNGAGTAGTAGLGRRCGGGGAGGRRADGYSGYFSGSGSAGTCYSGGSGGGGSNQTSNGSAGAGYGGAGGAGAVSCGGGSGNPGGGGGGTGESGTGGLLVIVCTGNIVIGSGGIVSANGSAGAASSYGGGGGSGGGSVNVFYGRELANNGSIAASGGAGGATGYPGGAGGAGCVTADCYNF